MDVTLGSSPSAFLYCLTYPARGYAVFAAMAQPCMPASHRAKVKYSCVVRRKVNNLKIYLGGTGISLPLCSLSSLLLRTSARRTTCIPRSRRVSTCIASLAGGVALAQVRAEHSVAEGALFGDPFAAALALSGDEPPERYINGQRISKLSLCQGYSVRMEYGQRDKGLVCVLGESMFGLAREAAPITVSKRKRQRTHAVSPAGRVLEKLSWTALPRGSLMTNW